MLTQMKPNAPQMMAASHEELERENKRQSWKPFWHLIKSVKFPWLLIIACIVLSLLQGNLYLIFPSYTEQIYNGNFSSALAVTAVLVVLGQALLTSGIQFVAGYTANLNQMRFQNYIWRKLSRLPVSYFEKNEPRDLISRTTQDTLSMSEFMSYSISYFLSGIYTFMGSAVMIVSYDYRLALSQLICIPLCYVIGIIAGRVYFKMNNRIQGRLSDMTRYFATVLPYITLVKIFGQEKREEQAGNGWIANHFKTEIQNSVYGLAISFANTVTDLVRTLIIIFTGLWLIRRGAIDIGQWIAFYQYANMLNNNFRLIMSQWQALKQNQGACARISAATDAAPEENKGTLEAEKADGDIEFKDVSFAYGEQNVLNNVSFTAESGKITAIVGPSGAGKSTILNLVERFYIPDKGSITWCGKNASEYELTSWRRNIGYIPQDTQLLAGTIRDNITHGVAERVSQEKLEEVARKADILDDIQRLPKDFDTQVGENGAKLSGGQKQRIAIARALLTDSKILVLDEATSNLDAESEHQIKETLKEVSKGCTVLMVAHRMDTVKDADKIIVMDKTRVAAQGTHEELMRSSSLYHRLVEIQSAGVAV